jgi:hypothetical protein
MFSVRTREDKGFWTNWQQTLPELNLLLISPWMSTIFNRYSRFRELLEPHLQMFYLDFRKADTASLKIHDLETFLRT